VHFVGIGGIGMCGIAELLHHEGYRVTGSDLKEGPTTERLRELGIAVSVGHAAAQVGDADAVVHSSAIPDDNPELREARARGVPTLPRGEMLAEIMRTRDGIAVAGSHGKTTTTALIAHVLEQAGLAPSALVGGRVPGAARGTTGARLGKGHWLVAEADESDGSFLQLAPVVAVVTNVDAEHLDHYGDLEAVRDAFARFAGSVPFWSRAVVGIDDPGVQAIVPRIARRTLRFGFSAEANWRASDPEASGLATRFRVHRGGEVLGHARVPLPGRYNVLNGLAALAVAAELDVPFAAASEALAAFPGVERRFQLRGEAGGVRVVDDYAHHPAELRAVLRAAREQEPGRLVAVFQPHRYTRTRDCFEDFARAFHEADRVVVAEVYAAGEAPLPGFDGAALAERIRSHGHRDVHYGGGLDELATTLPERLRAGDLVLTLGAGSITSLGPRLLAALGGSA